MSRTKHVPKHAPSLVVVTVANNKGGCGKTTLTHHIGRRAAELGLRVLVVDTDRQGDVYRRFVGDDGDLLDRPPSDWSEGCSVVYSPDEYALSEVTGRYDLVLVDTPPKSELPEATVASSKIFHVALVPVDGVDAARNANETVGSAIERGVPCILVLNGVNIGGKTAEQKFDRMFAELPTNVIVARTRVPKGPGVSRTADRCDVAWTDVWKGRDSTAMRDLCDEVLVFVGLKERPRGVSNG